MADEIEITGSVQEDDQSGHSGDLTYEGDIDFTVSVTVGWITRDAVQHKVRGSYNIRVYFGKYGMSPENVAGREKLFRAMNKVLGRLIHQHRLTAVLGVSQEYLMELAAANFHTAVGEPTTI